MGSVIHIGAVSCTLLFAARDHFKTKLLVMGGCERQVQNKRRRVRVH
jgi:hypothetical protein